jgi:hypothetical protein
LAAAVIASAAVVTVSAVAVTASAAAVIPAAVTGDNGLAFAKLVSLLYSNLRVPFH